MSEEYFDLCVMICQIRKCHVMQIAKEHIADTFYVSKKGTITFDISQSVTLLPSKYDAIINLGCKIGITESATFLENIVRT